MNFPIDAETKIADLESTGKVADAELKELMRWVCDLINESYEVGLTNSPNSAHYPICIEREIEKARERFPSLDENPTRRLLKLQNEAYFAGCEKRKEKTA